jgi:thiamine biosynthesis protein ThiS
MHILLNGEAREVPQDSTLSELLATLDLQHRRFAVEINAELIPRSDHSSHRLRADDRVEVVQAIGGG